MNDDIKLEEQDNTAASATLKPEENSPSEENTLQEEEVLELEEVAVPVEANDAADIEASEAAEDKTDEAVEVVIEAETANTKKTIKALDEANANKEAGFGVGFNEGEFASEDGSRKKIVMIIAGVILLVAAIAAAIFIGYNTLGKKAVKTASNNPSEEETSLVNETETETKESTQAPTKATQEATKAPQTTAPETPTKSTYSLSSSSPLIVPKSISSTTGNSNVRAGSTYKNEKILSYEKHNTTADAKNIIILDAGHGGNDPGAIQNGSTEKIITLSMATKVKALLEAKGYTVYMTRTTDTAVDLESRVAYENSYYCELFVSLHCNSYDSSSVSGLECFYTSTKSGKYATSFFSALKNNGVIELRKAEYSEYRVTRKAENPALLVEMGYLTNSNDNNVLNNKQDELAAVLANAINSAVLANR